MALGQSKPVPAEINRRNLLTAAPAVGFASLVAAGAQAVEAETPVAALFREWLVAFRHEKATYLAADDYCDDPACSEATERLLSVTDQMLAAPAVGAADWLLKFWAASEGGDLAMCRAGDTGLWAEARALVGMGG